MNLGEVLPTGSHDKNQISVTTNLQAFGLIVTAEPYYSVTMPSDVVVMQNFVEDKTQGVVEQVNAHYSLLPRGAYEETAGRHTVSTDHARRKVAAGTLRGGKRDADRGGGRMDKYAPDTIQTAKTALQNAEDIHAYQKNRKECITFAREAVQSAEDARIITIRKIKAEDEENARQARLAAEQQAQQSQLAAQQAQLAEQQQAAARAQADAAAAEARARAAAAQQAQQQADQAASGCASS